MGSPSDDDDGGGGRRTRPAPEGSQQLGVEGIVEPEAGARIVVARVVDVNVGGVGGDVRGHAM